MRVDNVVAVGKGGVGVAEVVGAVAAAPVAVASATAVDVAAAHPGGRHGEDAHEHPDVSAGQHRLLLGMTCDVLFRRWIEILN